MDAQRGIARRMVVGLPPDGLSPAWERDFAAYATAGVIVFRRDFRDLDALRALTSRLRELARPRRLFIALDEEGGFVSQLAGHLTVPPSAALLGRAATADELTWIARVTGERLRALGFDWDFAPVADVHSRALNPVIGPRAFGSEPGAVAGAVRAWLAGFRAAGIASCLKHFPGHGETLLDSHLALPKADFDRATLDARELAPFRANLDADSVMTAHVVYPALDRLHPATLSAKIVGEFLRGELRYDGVVFSDDLEMKAVSAKYSVEDTATLAVAAGIDELLFCHDHDRAAAALDALSYVAAGDQELLNRIDESYRRIRKLKKRALTGFSGAGEDELADLIGLQGKKIAAEILQGSR